MIPLLLVASASALTPKALLLSVLLPSQTFAFDGDFSCSFVNEQNHTGHRGIHDDDDYKWANNEVPYYFDGRVNNEDRRVVREQMDRIESNVACIRFQETTRSAAPRHHLRVMVGPQPCARCQGNWCRSRFSGHVHSHYAPQINFYSHYGLSGRGCNIGPIGALHELMHVMGIEHTQKRTDRDDYIEVNDECILDDDSARHQYKKLENYPEESIRDKVPYKCNSIMHYGQDTFAISNTCPTMEAKEDNNHDCVFNSGDALQEDWDWLKMHVCGTDITGPGTEGVITSPNYPENYDTVDPYVEKTYPIEVAEGSRISLTFTDFAVEEQSSCGWDWVQVEDGDGTELLGRSCGFQLPAPVVSNTNSITVTFHSDYSVTERGFSATWKMV